MAATSEGEAKDAVQLLSEVVPAFLELAILHGGQEAGLVSSLEGKGTVSAMEKTERFYPSVRFELQQLATTLASINFATTVTLSNESRRRVQKLLKRLENRLENESLQDELRTAGLSWKPCGLGLDAVFPKLHGLGRLVQHHHVCHASKSTEASALSLALWLQELVNLRPSQRKYRQALLADIEKCSKELETAAGRTRTPLTSLQNQQQDRLVNDETANHSTPSYTPRRQRINSLHARLVGLWLCQCHDPRSEAMLRLASFGTEARDDDMKLELLFRDVRGQDSNPSRDSDALWQQGTIVLWATQATVQIVAPGSAMSRPRAPYDVGRAQRGTPVDNMCTLLRDLPLHNCLMLIFDRDQLYELRPREATNQASGVFSLANLLQSYNLKLIAFCERLTLYAVLANTFLQLHGGPWLQRNLQPDNIYFHCLVDRSPVNIRKPFLKTSALEAATASEDDTSDVQHPYPPILALGLLILQIECSVPIRRARARYFPEQLGDHLGSFVSTAGMLLRKSSGHREDMFIDVVDACVRPATFPPGLDYDDDFLHNEVHRLIISPLETLLDVGYKVNFRDLETTLEEAWPRGEDFHKEEPPKPTMRHRGQNVDVLQAGHDTPKIDPDPKARIADKWFERLYGVHDLLDAKCVSAKLERHVRVAILDSGVDLPLPVCQETHKRIIGFKDYIDTENKAHIDTDGHGTHTLALVMKAAPKADVYVARVFPGRGDNGAISKRNSKEVNTDIAERDSMKTHQGIAQAIRDAVDEWQVDIVSMSFGFERAIPEIGEAIRYAESKNVVLFAAANNKGGNEDVCFPARLSQVICVHAADGEGNPASFTASSEQGEDNFAVLGERVMSSWPLGLGQGHQVRKSGTSCATPIAAGIAAMVLYFARSYLALNPDKFPADRFHFEKLSTTDGMRKVFHRLAKPRGAGYNYVCRWEIFEYTLDSTFMDLILMDLKKI